MHVEWQNSITIFLNICISHAIHAWYIYLYIYLYNPIHASDGSIETLFIYLNLFGIGVFWVETLQLHLAEYEKIGVWWWFSSASDTTGWRFQPNWKILNISQIGSFPQIAVRRKNVWNHHLLLVWCDVSSMYDVMCLPWILRNKNYHSRPLCFWRSYQPAPVRNLSQRCDQVTS